MNEQRVREGAAIACREGKPITANPWREKSPQWVIWRGAWQETWAETVAAVAPTNPRRRAGR